MKKRRRTVMGPSGRLLRCQLQVTYAPWRAPPVVFNIDPAATDESPMCTHVHRLGPGRAPSVHIASFRRWTSLPTTTVERRAQGASKVAWTGERICKRFLNFRREQTFRRVPDHLDHSKPTDLSPFGRMRPYVPHAMALDFRTKLDTPRNLVVLRTD